MSRSNDDRKSYISPDGWFSLSYPNNWRAEIEDDCTSLYKEYDGVGALQISAYCSESRPSARESLVEYMDDESIPGEIVTNRLANGREVAKTEFESEESFTRLWFISEDFYLLFVTYICNADYKNVELDEVETIIRSIRIAR